MSSRVTSGAKTTLRIGSDCVGIWISRVPFQASSNAEWDGHDPQVATENPNVATKHKRTSSKADHKSRL